MSSPGSTECAVDFVIGVRLRSAFQMPLLPFLFFLPCSCSAPIVTETSIHWGLGFTLSVVPTLDSPVSCFHAAPPHHSDDLPTQPLLDAPYHSTRPTESAFSVPTLRVKALMEKMQRMKSSWCLASGRPYHYPIILSVCSSRWSWQLFSTYSEWSFLTQHPPSCKSAWHLFALSGARTWSEFSYHPIHTNTRLLKPQTSWIRHLSCTTSDPFRHTYLLFQPPNQLHMETFCQHLLPPILGLICFHCGLGLCRHPSVSS